MSLHMTIDEWKAGIPQRELEQMIREYEESLPEREKMTAQARENNQTRFFLEDRFYELHKKELADMMAEKAAASGVLGFREGNQGGLPITKNSSEGSNVGFTPHPTSPTLGEGLDSAYSEGGQNGLISFGTENQGVLPITKNSFWRYVAQDKHDPSASSTYTNSHFMQKKKTNSINLRDNQVASGFGKNLSDDTFSIGKKGEVSGDEKLNKLEGLGAIAAAYQVLTENGYNDINKHQTMSYMLDANIFPGTGEVLGAIKEDYWDKPTKKFNQSWKEAGEHINKLFPEDSRDGMLSAFLRFPYTVHFYQNNGKNDGFREIELDSQKDMLNNQLGAYMAQNADYSLNHLVNNAIAGQSQQAIIQGFPDDEIGRIINTEPNKMPKDFVDRYKDNPYTKDLLAIYDKHIKY